MEQWRRDPGELTVQVLVISSVMVLGDPVVSIRDCLWKSREDNPEHVRYTQSTPGTIARRQESTQRRRHEEQESTHTRGHEEQEHTGDEQ
jgi:hypothetical protein